MIAPRMIRRTLSVLGLAVAAVLVASGCGSRASDAATLNSRDRLGSHTQHISREQLQREVSQLVSNKSLRPLLSQNFAIGPDDDSTDAKLTAAWLTQTISQRVVDAEFAAQHLSVSPAYTAQATTNIKQQYSDAVFNSFPKSLRDDLVGADARLLAVLQSCATDRLVSHILVRTEAEANAVLAQIRAGAQFTTVAQSKSIDGSASSGGLLGCLAPGEFDPVFQRAAEQASFDSVTAPVKSQFGYHLILVRHWDPRLASDQQLAQGLQAAAGAALDARLKAVKVWVDPRYGSWGPHDTQNGKVFGVDPPAVPSPRDQREQREQG